MRFEIANLSIDQELRRFVADEILPKLPEINLDEESFWRKFSDIVDEMAPENAHLLAERERLQKLIDAYHKERRGAPDIQQYKEFLVEIGYLAPVGDDFSVQAEHIDREVAEMAGPQLVVPVDNARYALNAANARWGSLYDAFYGTDALGRTAKPGGYDKGHGEQVIAAGRKFLDETLPLNGMSWADIASVYVKEAALVVQDHAGREAGLKTLKRFAGYTGSADAPSAILLENNGLLVEIIIDRTSPIGRDDAAGISDIHLEAALTAIMDCEDSVAAVDAEDKIAIYRNWLGLMNGNLTAIFQKSGRQHSRSLAADKHFSSPNGDKQVSCRGRALMLVRNVGLLMTSDAVLDREGRQVPEGIIDAMITSLIAMYDVGKGGLEGGGRRQNSQAGSIYIVKPKMHGPLEVAFSDKLFGRVEDALGLRRYTLKMGIMDEERRTTVNLKECIRAARHRVFFINTGFLDRTGDEIHTSMQAGAVVRKNKMKSLKWIKAYEDWNVDNGLKAGLLGHAQIGKGMWAMPDLMQKMLAEKINHPQAGATTAWVPSPTAATLHALHYHQIDVFDRARAISKRAAASLEDILTIPLSHGENFSEAEVKEELDNNIQGILGYVVRWVDQGIGCSKVPDINDIGLMEDRATLRISAQHVANWLHHGICTAEQVTDSLHRMARAVDGQNSGDPNYKAMADNFADSFAYQAAQDLIFEGLTQPSGYTEPILHAYRRKVKTSSQ